MRASTRTESLRRRRRARASPPKDIIAQQIFAQCVMPRSSLAGHSFPDPFKQGAFHAGDYLGMGARTADGSSLEAKRAAESSDVVIDRRAQRGEGAFLAGGFRSSDDPLPPHDHRRAPHESRERRDCDDQDERDAGRARPSLFSWPVRDRSTSTL